jgi:hypothetical protein
MADGWGGNTPKQEGQPRPSKILMPNAHLVWEVGDIFILNGERHVIVNVSRGRGLTLR